MIAVHYPDATMRYGTTGRQVADVFEPPGPTDSLVLVFPGGAWRTTDRARSWAAGRALAEAGNLVASVEYRRGPGQWAAALDDVVTAIEQIQLSGREWTSHNEAPRRITVLGHSSGGHLALWAASRASLPTGSRWHTTDPMITGAVVTAPAADLTAMAEGGIGDGAVAEFLGGSPDEVPATYAVADPARLEPSVPLRLLHGDDDQVIPLAVTTSYVEGLAATADHTLSVVEGAAHDGWGDPNGPLWEKVLAAVTELSR